jgi:hypothetical protein
VLQTSTDMLQVQCGHSSAQQHTCTAARRLLACSYAKAPPSLMVLLGGSHRAVVFVTVKALLDAKTEHFK